VYRIEVVSDHRFASFSDRKLVSGADGGIELLFPEGARFELCNQRRRRKMKAQADWIGFSSAN
jgi:hypothetical protein